MTEGNKILQIDINSIFLDKKSMMQIHIMKENVHVVFKEK